ncbi:MAG TPA: hypothetical protein VGI80_02825 [Pyrinomonadaceae bacterium]|jgi:hypothetical protein
MHCPSCGQQQVSNETKFCNRCGLPLNVVAEVVRYGGYLPQLAELEAQKSKTSLFNKKNGVIASVFFMITFMMLLPALFGVADLDTAAGVSAIIGVFGGMMLLIASMVFLPSSRKKYPMPFYGGVPPTPQGLNAPAQGHALPPQQSIPVSSYGPPQAGNWRDTNDLQPSVTESTTRMLDDEARRQ